MKIVTRIIFLVLLIFYIFFILRTGFDIDGERYFTLVDDAMISMRYARNISDGYGIVWNPGEEPVEGFSNLGWTIIMATIHLLELPEAKISLTIMLLGVAILLANLLVIKQLTKKLFPEYKFAPVIAIVLVGFYFPIVFWTLRGMEIGLISLVISSTFLLILKQNRWSTLLGFLGPIIRFDIFAQLILLGYLYKKYKLIASIIGSALILTLFRIIHFGMSFPLTYYLKVEGVSIYTRVMVGLTVFLQNAIDDIWLPIVFIIIGWILGARLKTTIYLVALFVIQVAYSIYVGGDYAEQLVGGSNRFIAQGVPYLMIAAAVGMEEIADRFSLWIHHKRLIVSLLVAITLIATSGNEWLRYGFYNAPMLASDIERTEKALNIRSKTSEDAIVAAHAVGQIGYFSNRKIIDLLGKNDPIIALGPPATEFRPGHNKWNYEYSISDRCPDIIADDWGEVTDYLSGLPSIYKMSDYGYWIRIPNDCYTKY